MTPEQHQSVRATFARILPQARTAAAMFYQRLFQQHPELRPLFRHDSIEQGHKLIQALAVIVKSVDRTEELRPFLHELGQRHIGFGARPEHFPMLREALLDTLAQTTGDAFTPEARQAWSDMFDEVSAIMMEVIAEQSIRAGKRAAAAG